MIGPLIPIVAYNLLTGGLPLMRKKNSIEAQAQAKSEAQ